jgi:hypothetical protein
MKRHYKKRCGQGKAAPNPFLMNLAGPALDSGFRGLAGIDKSVSIQPLFKPMRKRRPERKLFLKMFLTAGRSTLSAAQMNKLWITICKIMKYMDIFCWAAFQGRARAAVAFLDLHICRQRKYW